MTALLVALAGAAGTLARYFLGLLLTGTVLGGPAGTFAVNVIGCFLMGAASAAFGGHPRLVIATTGFLGGLTTYSAFNQALLASALGGSLARAATYATATFVACLVAGYAGHVLAR